MNSSLLQYVRAAAWLPLALSSAHAVTLTANFDALNPFVAAPSGYTENGIRFTSPTPFNVATGTFGAVLFGWGGYTYPGNALYVHNDGWVGISAPGAMLDRVSFKYGFDWNGYAIENGLMDTTFGWQALSGGSIVETGAKTWGRENRTHGGFNVTVDPAAAFDTLLIRSTAVAYQGIYQATPQPPGYWYYERGAVTGFGEANHIAFDEVTLVVTAVPDDLPMAAALAASLGFLALHQWRARRRA